MLSCAGLCQVLVSFLNLKDKNFAQNSHMVMEVMNSGVRQTWFYVLAVVFIKSMILGEYESFWASVATYEWWEK